MSRRVTYDTKMTDKDLVASTLRSLNVQFTVDKDVYRIIAGNLKGLSINTKTGKIDTDEDYGHDALINGLKIAYTEADVRREYNRTGTSIMSREVVTYQGIEGVVLLKCRKAVG